MHGAAKASKLCDVRLARCSILVSLVLAVATIAAAQDFDPGGRHRPKPAPSGRPRPRPTPGPDAPDAQTPAALIERYTKVVLAQPGAAFPLQRLAQLYRERDGKLDALATDFDKRAQAGGDGAYAATVTLAGIYKIQGRADEAIRAFERAIALRPGDPSALLALARAQQDRGDATAARAHYEHALPLQSAQTDKEQTLRTLVTLALETKDFAGAKAYHDQIVKLEPTSLFVRGELGRELFARAEYDRAIPEFAALVAAATGDNRTLAPALTELGKAQAKAHKHQDALASLKKALSAAGQEAAVRAEIYETISEIYRADQQLPLLIKQLEDEHPGDYARLALLGALYEETGDAGRAIATYRRALLQSPRQIDLRLKMVRLLQTQGDLDKAISEYEALIRAAPNNPEFVFEQCEALIQRGDRVRALKLLGELEARAGADEESLSRLADFYGRIAQGDAQLRVLTRLSQVGASDPTHLVDLGDRYFQDGNAALALQTWRRILTTVSPRARALAALGDVLLEHDMGDEALASFREAVGLEPANAGYKKQLAAALERRGDFHGARVLWQELEGRARQSGDKLLSREARARIVALWAREKILEQQLPALAAAFAGAPPDVEAGRTLAEAQLHLRRLGDAEIALRKVIELAPGDADSYLALERTLVSAGKLQEAVAVLERLIGVDPKRAREVYQRMAQYALQLRLDDDAIRYAAQAVELNPQDAEGHRRLGEMYRARQDVDHAIGEFRQAIAKNDRLFVVYFALADLLLARGEAEEADRLFRRVIRGAPDAELVARAARLSMQINLGRSTLESLEQELLPLAIGNPTRKIYRNVLVEIYGNLSFSLVSRVRHGDGRDAASAREALARIGGRAVKPLLDALADGDPAQQRIAIDVLGYVQNKNAGPALFAFATGPADAQLRARAMIAAGSLRDAALLPKFEALLLPKGSDAFVPSDPVALAAAWGMSRIADRRALPAIRALLDRGTPEMRALAALGLAEQRDRSAIPAIAAIAKAQDAGTIARAGAAYALGELGAEAEAQTLLALAQGADGWPRTLAFVALARLGSGRTRASAVSAMADALFSGGGPESGRARARADATARSGAASLVLLANPDRAKASVELLPVPDGALDLDALIDSLVPRGFSVAERAATLVKFSEAIGRAASGALLTSGDRALSVLSAFGGREGGLSPFVAAGGSPDTASAREVAASLARSLEGEVLPLARHPNATLRGEAVVFLSRGDSPEAKAAVVAAAGDADERVQRLAIAAIDRQGTAEAAAIASRVALTHASWSMRVLAAQALGRIGGRANAAAARSTLQRVATTDPYALVREAALSALASFDPPAAAEVAARLATTDPEPRLREAAAQLLRAR